MALLRKLSENLSRQHPLVSSISIASLVSCCNSMATNDGLCGGGIVVVVVVAVVLLVVVVVVVVLLQVVRGEGGGCCGGGGGGVFGSSHTLI